MSIGKPSGAVEAIASLPVEARSIAGRMVGPQPRALYGLKLAADVGYPRIALDELSEALDRINIALSPLQLRNTLTPLVESGAVSKRKVGERLVYGLTQDGERELSAAMGSGLHVMAIAAGKPFTARTDIATVLSEQRGQVRITDPYYGSRTAQLLAMTRSAAEVRFLTAECGRGESTAIAGGAFRDLMKELPAVSVRLVSNPKEIAHDHRTRPQGHRPPGFLCCKAPSHKHWGPRRRDREPL